MLAAGFAPAVKCPLRWFFVLQATASAWQKNQQSDKCASTDARLAHGRTTNGARYAQVISSESKERKQLSVLQNTLRVL